MKQNRESATPNSSDAFKMKQALTDYLSKAEDPDLRSLRIELEVSQPEIEGGELRIGPWTYDREQNALIRHLPPDELRGYDYRAQISSDANEYKVVEMNRIEVFKR